jgi:hypothetical protein
VIGYEDGSELVLGKGGHVFLPRHVKHRVSRTSESCLWIAVHGFLMPCG